MERNDYLIRRKFYAYLIPGVMMAAALQLGNLVDSVFLGNYLGPAALSASSIGIPVVFLAQVPLMIFAVGGSAVAGICLGKRERQEAARVFSGTFFLTLIILAANALAALVYTAPLARALAADGTLTGMTEDFIRAYLVGMPALGVFFFFGYFIAVDNHPRLSAAMHIAANGINLLLDFLFLGVLHMGIAASVYSTILGYVIAGIVCTALYLRAKDRMLEFGKGRIRLQPGRLSEVVRTGLSAGMMTLLAAVRMLVLNSAVLILAGTAGMTIYAVCTNSMFLVQLCLNGVVGVIQTVIGVLYGEKDYFAIRKLLQRICRICLTVSLALTLLYLAAPQLISGMFGVDMDSLQDTMFLTLRLYALSFPCYAFNSVIQNYYPLVGRPRLSLVNTLLQGLIILIPATLLLLVTVGIPGIGAAAAAAETAAFLIVWFMRKHLQKCGRADGTDISVLPEPSSEPGLNVTVRGTSEDAAGLAHRLVEYCTAQGAERKTANIVGVAGEELVEHIAGYSGQDGRISYIDVFLCRTDDRLVLRVRDDGVFFNPLEEDEEDRGSDGLDLTGLQLIRALALKMDYSRVLEMNNTVVEVALQGTGGSG